MTARQEKVRVSLDRLAMYERGEQYPEHAAALAEVQEWEALLQTVATQLKFATAVIAEAEKLHPGITRQAGLAAGGTDITS